MNLNFNDLFRNLENCSTLICQISKVLENQEGHFHQHIKQFTKKETIEKETVKDYLREVAANIDLTAVQILSDFYKDQLRSKKKKFDFSDDVLSSVKAHVARVDLFPNHQQFIIALQEIRQYLYQTIIKNKIPEKEIYVEKVIKYLSFLKFVFAGRKKLYKPILLEFCKSSKNESKTNYKYRLDDMEPQQSLFASIIRYIKSVQLNAESSNYDILKAEIEISSNEEGKNLAKNPFDDDEDSEDICLDKSSDETSKGFDSDEEEKSENDDNKKTSIKIESKHFYPEMFDQFLKEVNKVIENLQKIFLFILDEKERNKTQDLNQTEKEVRNNFINFLLDLDYMLTMNKKDYNGFINNTCHYKDQTFHKEFFKKLRTLVQLDDFPMLLKIGTRFFEYTNSITEEEKKGFGDSVNYIEMLITFGEKFLNTESELPKIKDVENIEMAPILIKNLLKEYQKFDLNYVFNYKFQVMISRIADVCVVEKVIPKTFRADPKFYQYRYTVSGSLVSKKIKKSPFFVDITKFQNGLLDLEEINLEPEKEAADLGYKTLNFFALYENSKVKLKDLWQINNFEKELIIRTEQYQIIEKAVIYTIQIPAEDYKLANSLSSQICLVEYFLEGIKDDKSQLIYIPKILMDVKIIRELIWYNDLTNHFLKFQNYNSGRYFYFVGNGALVFNHFTLKKQKKKGNNKLGFQSYDDNILGDIPEEEIVTLKDIKNLQPFSDASYKYIRSSSELENMCNFDSGRIYATQNDINKFELTLDDSKVKFVDYQENSKNLFDNSAVKDLMFDLIQPELLDKASEIVSLVGEELSGFPNNFLVSVVNYDLKEKKKIIDKILSKSGTNTLFEIPIDGNKPIKAVYYKYREGKFFLF